MVTLGDGGPGLDLPEKGLLVVEVSDGSDCEEEWGEGWESGTGRAWRPVQATCLGARMHWPPVAPRRRRA